MTYDPDAPPPAKPSPVPSWVILGFILGGLCVYTFFRSAHPVAPSPSAAAAETPAPEAIHPVLRAQPLSRFLAVQELFAQSASYAVWENDTTQISVYDPDLGQFGECYEVTRRGEDYYFRTITSLTRPILTHGVPKNSLVEFTETAASRAQWLKDVSDENWRSFSNGVHEGMSQTPTPPPPAPAGPPAKVPAK